MPHWLVSAEHGRMPVYDMGEVERLKQFGWTLLNTGERPIYPVAAEIELASAPHERDVLIKVDGPNEARDEGTPKRKPGRPRKL